MRSYQHKYTNAQLDFKLTYGDKNETQLTFLMYIYIYIYIYIYGFVLKKKQNKTKPDCENMTKLA